MMLYVIATPIGHLQDMTFRAIETLKSCDLILCEDTRISIKLLNYYEIKKPLKSLHKFNEAKSLSFILEELKAGKIMALISDGGTPCISDPGARLVNACLEHKIPCSPIPGCCAISASLSVCGLLFEAFQFLGFLPKGRSKKRKLLQSILDYPGLSICYESPYRVKQTLEEMQKLNPNCLVFFAREVTKAFETFKRLPVSLLLKEIESSPVKGECTLIFSSNSFEKKNEGKVTSVSFPSL